MFIYLIVNSATGKYYVGQHKGNNLTKYLQDKRAAAKSGVSSHLFNAMRKYPKETWSIHPLVSTLTTRPELDHWESFFIALFKSRDPQHGYNICRGGEGFTGSHSDATRAKMSVTRSTPEYKKFAAENCKRLNPALGAVRSAEQLQAMSKRMLGRVPPNKGVPMSAEQRQKLVDNHVGMTGHRHSNETKARIAESNRSIAKARGYKMTHGAIAQRKSRAKKRLLVSQ